MSEQTFDAITVGTLNVTGSQSGGPGTVTNLTVSGNASIGDASTDTIGFYGATATTQPAAIAAVTTAALTSVTTTAATSTTPFGYSTAAQADAIVATLNAVAVRAAALTTQGNSFDTALTALGLTA
jgi:hypothetical protein